MTELSKSKKHKSIKEIAFTRPLTEIVNDELSKDIIEKTELDDI